MMIWWARFWFWWLAFVAGSWFVAEMASIADAHLTGRRYLVDYTLSDTIRRWSHMHRWIGLATMATAEFLMWHFFVAQNPS